MLYDYINITTSYFGNIRNVKNPLSIAGKAPKWYNGNEYKMLAPTYNILMDYKNKDINEHEYTIRFYYEVLYKYNPGDLLKALINQFGNNVTLMCYEKPGEFCHRRLVANYINESLNLNISEL